MKAWFDGPLGALTTKQSGRCRRVSSNEQPNWNDGNFDSTHINPGEVLEVPLLKGPGMIHHMWFTSHAGGMGELNALTLRIYWDGATVPAVEVPLGDFFACGQQPATVESLPVQVSPSGSLTCFWRMPFAESARITVTNDNAERGYGLYWQIDYVELDSLPPDTLHFYAKYRQEYPAGYGHDYRIAEIQGSGAYVGTVMTVTNAQDGWFGEGDDFFYIDGEEVPSLQGTGSEDYFNDGWGFRRRTSLWFGQPHGMGYEAGDGGPFYRWHIQDPVLFEKSLLVEIEHKGNWPRSEDAWFLERPDFFSSVAFWYQSGEPGPWPALPGYPERLVPWVQHHLVPLFQHATCTGGSDLKVTTMGMFGGRPSLWWDAASAGDRVEFEITIDQPGRTAIRLCAFKFGGSESPCFQSGDPGKGLFRVLLDGETVLDRCPFDTFEYGEPNLSLGEHVLAAGRHHLAFEALTDRPGPLGLEFLRTLALPPKAVREVKTHNEAHFFRLGIGRAVYAFRLAFGRLPESLKDLQDMDLLDAEYLVDEHGLPVKAWLEDGRFVAQARDWTHSWTGADARR